MAMVYGWISVRSFATICVPHLQEWSLWQLQTDRLSDFLRCRIQMTAKRRAEENSILNHGHQVWTIKLCLSSMLALLCDVANGYGSIQSELRHLLIEEECNSIGRNHITTISGERYDHEHEVFAFDLWTTSVLIWQAAVKLSLQISG